MCSVCHLPGSQLDPTKHHWVINKTQSNLKSIEFMHGVEPVVVLASWLKGLIAILDATDQPIERPQDIETHQEYYS